MSLLIRTFLFLLCINYLNAEDEEDLVAVASEFGEKLAEQQLPTKVSTYNGFRFHYRLVRFDGKNVTCY